MATREKTHQKVFELCKHSVLNRVRALTSEDRLQFLEYAASSNPVITSAWLDQFEGKTRPKLS